MARKFSSPLNDEDNGPQANNLVNSEAVSNLSRSPQRRSSPEPIPTQTGPSGDQLSPIPNRQQIYTGARPRTPSSFQRPSSTDEPAQVQLRRRRMDSLNLETPYHFEYDPATNRYLMPEAYIEIEGQELYLHFLHEQVRNADLFEDQVNIEEDFNLSTYHVSCSERSTSPQCQQSTQVPAQTQTSTPGRRNRTMSMNLENFPAHPVWRETGRELQALADAFARSPGRILVRQRAEQVDVSTLDRKKFWSLLKELFAVCNAFILEKSTS